MKRRSRPEVEVGFPMVGGGDRAAAFPLFVQRSSTMSESPKQPVKRFRAGLVTASVFKHENAKDGQQIVSYSVNFQSRYRDKKTGEWKTSAYYYAEDLPRLRLLLDKVYEFMVLDDKGGSES